MKFNARHHSDSLYRLIDEFKAYAERHPDPELDRLVQQLFGAVAVQSILTIGEVSKAQRIKASQPRKKTVTAEMVRDLGKKMDFRHGWKKIACGELHIDIKTLNKRLSE
jgi:hypothetical protein